MTANDRTPATPPRWATALVRLAVRDEHWREVALGDLAEEFEARSRRDGRRHARRWYARQSLSFGAAALAATVRGVLYPAGGWHMSSLVREFTVTFRLLFRQPLLTALVIGTLALGLGSNAATFGMIDALTLRPFSFPGVDRLVVLSENSVDDPFPQEAVAPATLVDLNARPLDSLAVLAGMEWWDVSLSGSGEPERVQGTKVSAAFFSGLSQTPSAGRFFTANEDRFGQHHVVVVSHGLWTRRYGRDPNLIGKTLRLDGEPYTVVGIAKEGFDFPNASQVWTPLAFTAEEAAVRARTYLTVLGRLADDATRETAQAEVGAIFDTIARTYPADTRGRSLVVRSLTAAMVDVGLPRVLTLWQAAAALVLLIACVNVANLLLARGVERRQELAVRLAIGAGRAHLVRQLLLEAVVLAALSVPAALGVAAGAYSLLRTTMPAELVRYIPGWDSMGVDWRVAAVTFAAAGLAAIVCGLLPALQSSRPDVTTTLRESGRSATASVTRNRLRRGLVVAQLALALPLLVMAGLSAIAAQRFGSGPQGYDPAGVVALRTILPDRPYPDADSRRRFVERLLDEASRISRADRAAVATSIPAAGGFARREVHIEGRPVPEGAPPQVIYRAISGSYFDVMRVPIEEGRAITAADGPGAEPVAVVSRSMAERFWPGQSALGHRVRLGRDAEHATVIVGIAGDTIDDWFQYRHEPTAYVPITQAPASSVYLVARVGADVDPAALIPELRGAVLTADPDQAVFDVATMQAVIRRRTTGLRVIGQVMAAFGGVAVLLAALGIYGVMSHYVAVRHSEIGVRLALGATPRDLLRLTLGQTARLAGLGLGLGLGAAAALARLMENALFGVVSVEPVLFVSVTAGLVALALAATLLPAWRAVRTDVLGAIRG